MDKTKPEQILDITLISDRLANRFEKHMRVDNGKDYNHDVQEELISKTMGMMTKRWPLSFQTIVISYKEFDNRTAMVVVSNGKMKRGVELYLNTKTDKLHLSGSDIEVDTYTLGIIFGTLFLSTITTTGD